MLTLLIHATSFRRSGSCPICTSVGDPTSAATSRLGTSSDRFNACLGASGRRPALQCWAYWPSPACGAATPYNSTMTMSVFDVPGPCRRSSRLARSSIGGRDRRLRRRQTTEARYFDPLRRVPSRSVRSAPPQSRRQTPAQASDRRALNTPTQEHGAGALLRRDAGAHDPQMAEPRGRGSPVDRGADPADAGLARDLR